MEWARAEERTVMTSVHLTEGRPLAVILRFTLPLFLGNMFMQLYNLVDTVIVGRFLGENALAAVGSTGTIIFLVQGLATGLTTGFTVLTAQHFGAMDPKGTRRSASNALMLSFGVILILTFFSTLFMHRILLIMNTPAEIYDDAYRYIIIICAGLFSIVLYTLGSSLLTAVGNSRLPLVFLMVGAVCNIALDLLFIPGLGMGTEGAAYATVISQVIAALVAAVYIGRKMPDLRPYRDFWRLDRGMAIRQIRVGVPMALQFGITASGTMVLQTAVNTFGPTAVAAFTAASKMSTLLTQGFAALGQSMAAYGGQNYGAARPDRIRSGVRAAMQIDIAYAALISILILLLLHPLMCLFFPAGTDTGKLMEFARPYIYFSMSCYIPLGMIFIFRNIMQGCGYGFLPMMGGVVELVARVIPAAVSMRLGSYLLAAACDASAWLTAGLFTAFAYHFYVIGRIEQRIRRGRARMDASPPAPEKE